MHVCTLKARGDVGGGYITCREQQVKKGPANIIRKLMEVPQVTEHLHSFVNLQAEIVITIVIVGIGGWSRTKSAV
jgi:hypothetical protein